MKNPELFIWTVQEGPHGYDGPRGPEGPIGPETSPEMIEKIMATVYSAKPAPVKKGLMHKILQYFRRQEMDTNEKT